MNIEVTQLTKNYGQKRVLDNINININTGIHGLLGPNGAGKTTFMKILSTLTPKTSGKVYFDGIDIENKREIRKIIGYLPQEFSFYPNFTVYEVLDYFAALSNKNYSRREIMDRLEEVHLKDLFKVKTKALSGGMKRRLGIAVAIIGDPKVLIVDEPTVGLDPEERIKIRKMLSEIGKEKTVLLSTHIVEDIALSCNTLSVLNRGKIIYNGTVNSMIESAKGYVWNVSTDIHKVEEYSRDFIVVSSILDEDRAMLKIMSKDKPSSNAETTYPSLEDAYMKLMKEL
ncbi:MAG: ABC transporter ATP-binding protein [Tissierellaceae bacterium]